MTRNEIRLLVIEAITDNDKLTEVIDKIADAMLKERLK